MAPSNRTTRRALLRALGGVGAAGVATGTVTAGGGTGRRRGGGRGGGRGRGRGGGRETYTDEGIVVQFEDCQTAHVRGNKNRIDEVTVIYDVCYGGDGPCPDGSRVTITDDPPLTIDRDKYLSVPSDVDFRIAVVAYRMDRGETGGVSQSRDCPLEK